MVASALSRAQGFGVLAHLADCGLVGQTSQQR